MISWLEDLVKWKPLYYASLVIAVLVLFTYFFFPTLSVILFFALLGLWSRVPCMFNIYTKELEIIDFLAVMIAVNIGGFPAAFFAAILMMFSHFFAKIEYPSYAFIGAAALFTASLSTPLLYNYLGQNLLLTMYAFTIVRYIVRAILGLAIFPAEQFTFVPAYIVGLGLAYLTNTVYILLFGNYITKMFTHGFRIHWGFFAVAIGILGFIGAKKWLEKKYKALSRTAK